MDALSHGSDSSDVLTGRAVSTTPPATRPLRTRSMTPRVAISPRHRRSLTRVLGDFLRSVGRVVKKTRPPSPRSIGRYLGHQVLVNAIAWTAGLLAVAFVRHFFQVRGLHNLWGLAAWGDRTLVSAGDYQALTNATSYLAGLVMLIVVRHFILRVSTELHDLRLERDDFD